MGLFGSNPRRMGLSRLAVEHEHSTVVILATFLEIKPSLQGRGIGRGAEDGAVRLLILEAKQLLLSAEIELTKYRASQLLNRKECVINTVGTNEKCLQIIGLNLEDHSRLGHRIVIRRRLLPNKPHGRLQITFDRSD